MPPVKTPAAAEAPAAKSGDIVNDLFDKAYDIRERQESLNRERGGVRDSLRSLRAAGVLNTEQAAEVEELFPTVERKRKDKDNADGEN
jgi:hypothetical protein